MDLPRASEPGESEPELEREEWNLSSTAATHFMSEAVSSPSDPGLDSELWSVAATLIDAHRAPFRAERPDCINAPGRWDFMISYTQRNPAAELIAETLHSSMLKRGKTVWLDVKMKQLNTTAMQEAAQNSGCILAIVTGPCARAEPVVGEQPADNAYFKRDACLDELRWARQAGIPIQPVIHADDKKRIDDLLMLAPEDLKDLKEVDIIHLDRSRPNYWERGVTEILENVDHLQLTPTSFQGSH